MNRFIRKITLFSILVLIPFILVELVLTLKENSFTIKYKYVSEHLKDINILLLGHSHMENGLVPQILGENTYNLAISGRQSSYDMQLAELFIPKMPNLKKVIWPLGYNFQYLSYEYPCMIENETFNNCWSLNSTYICMYYKYMGLSYDYKSFLYYSELMNSALDYSNRLLQSDNDLINKNKTTLGYEALYYENRNKNWHLQQLPFELDINKSNYKKKAYKENLSNISKIASICHEYGVEFIIVTFPHYKSFIDKTNTKGLKDMDLFINDIKNKYPVSYYNYFQDNRFDENDFFNSSHLNHDGALKFSKIFAADINNK